MSEEELYKVVTEHAGTQSQIAKATGLKLWKVIAIQAEERVRVKIGKHEIKGKCNGRLY